MSNLKNTVYPTIYPSMEWEEIDSGISVSIRIWTLIAYSIFYGDYQYAT